MNIGSIVKDQQPNEFNKLQAHKRKRKRKKRRREESLSTEDFEKMMKHSCYRRVGGAMRQVR